MVLADRCFWVSLLSRKVMLGCVTFLGKQNTKIILNLLDPMLEWKLRFFYARFEGQGAPVARVSLCSGITSCPRLGALRRRAGAGAKGSSRGPTALDKEVRERLARQDEEDLQAGLALSRKEARRSGLLVSSPKASMGPASLGPEPPSMSMVVVEADAKSPIPVFEREASEAPG
ncbi:hypothetical protein ACLOJK_019666 [Asimina triloba]